MARFVTLQTEGDDGWPVTEEHPTADRDEVAGAVNESYPEVVAVMVPEVVTVTEKTTTKAGTVTEKTYDMQTANMVPDGTTEETGVTLTRLVDPGGSLCVYAGSKLLKQYPAGEWRSCSADAPEWLVTA